MAPSMSAGVERCRRDFRAVLGPGGREPSSAGPFPPTARWLSWRDYAWGNDKRDRAQRARHNRDADATRSPRDEAVSPRALRRSPRLGAVTARTRFVRSTAAGRDGGHNGCADLDEDIRQLGRDIGMDPPCGQSRSNERGAGSLEMKLCGPPMQFRIVAIGWQLRSLEAHGPSDLDAAPSAGTSGRLASDEPSSATRPQGRPRPKRLSSVMRRSLNHPHQGNPSSPP
jgi:hypothetical protein